MLYFTHEWRGTSWSRSQTNIWVTRFLHYYNISYYLLDSGSTYVQVQHDFVAISFLLSRHKILKFSPKILNTRVTQKFKIHRSMNTTSSWDNDNLYPPSHVLGETPTKYQFVALWEESYCKSSKTHSLSMKIKHVDLYQNALMTKESFLQVRKM